MDEKNTDNNIKETLDKLAVDNFKELHKLVLGEVKNLEPGSEKFKHKVSFNVVGNLGYVTNMIPILVGLAQLKGDKILDAVWDKSWHDLFDSHNDDIKINIAEFTSFMSSLCRAKLVEAMLLLVINNMVGPENTKALNDLVDTLMAKYLIASSSKPDDVVCLKELYKGKFGDFSLKYEGIDPLRVAEELKDALSKTNAKS